MEATFCVCRRRSTIAVASKLIRYQIYWIIGPFLLYTIAFGGSIVPKTNLIQDLLCRDYYMNLAQADPDFTYTPIMFGEDESRCTTPEVESKATNFMTGATLIAGLLAAMISPMLGELSDYYGRKPVLCYVACGSLVAEILTICAAKYPESFPVYWLYLGYACEGLCGSFIAGMAIANSYAADTTAPSKRNVAFGYFHGCLFTGVALGPLMAAQLKKIVDSLVVIFWIALALHLVFFVFLVLFVPESLSKRRQLAARQKRAKEKAKDMILNHGNGCTKLVYGAVSLFRPLKIFFPRGPGSSSALRRNLVVLAAIDFVVFGVAMGAMTVITIYIRKQFHWDWARQSVYMSIVNITRVSVLVIVLPVTSRLVRGRNARRDGTASHGCDTLDLLLIRVSVIFDICGYVGFILARDGNLFTLAGIVTSFGGMAAPTLQSSLTKHVPHDRTGQLLGASGLLHSIARLVAPILFNSIFAATTDKFRQTVFVCLAVAFGAAFVLTLALRKGVYLDQADAADVLSEDGTDES